MTVTATPATRHCFECDEQDKYFGLGMNVSRCITLHRSGLDSEGRIYNSYVGSVCPRCYNRIGSYDECVQRAETTA